MGPAKIIKTFRHSNGSEIVVTHSGDFNMYDCKRGSNNNEDVRWTDGVYCFAVNSSGFLRGDVKTGFGMAEEFALDYLTALGQPVKQ